MNRSGAFVLALVAVLTCAFGASAAQAGNFTASSYPTTITATSPLGSEDLKTEAGSVECAGHFEGTLTEASESVQITPIYTGCKAFGFFEATFNMNGCKFVWHAFSMDIECPGTNKIKIVAGPCAIEIGQQTEIKTLEFTSNGSDITVKPNLSNLAYTVTTDDFLCPFNGTGARTGASLTQAVAITVKATSWPPVSIVLDP